MESQLEEGSRYFSDSLSLLEEEHLHHTFTLPRKFEAKSSSSASPRTAGRRSPSSSESLSDSLESL